jgi:dTDP-4-dehydrorhamnose reductase
MSIHHQKFLSQKKILITGASGFLGWYLCDEAVKFNAYVLALCRSRKPSFFPEFNQNIQVLQCDLLNQEKISALFETYKPDIVIHAAALSQPNKCQEAPEESFAVNITASQHLALQCKEKKIYFVFTSTDNVFDGLKGDYDESSVVNPINIYGQHKVQAEEAILDANPNSIIARLPLMFGNPPPHAESFLQPFLKNLSEGKPLRLFTDEIRTPVSGEDAARGIYQLLSRYDSTKGKRIHLGGKEKISRFEFGEILCEVFSFSKDLLIPVKQVDIQMASPRPPDLSLNSTYAYSIGYNPSSTKEVLLKIKHQRSSEQLL